MTRVFEQWHFTSPQEPILRNGYCLCDIIKYTVIFFCVCAHVHSDVNNKPNTDSRAERVKEKLYPLQPINFCSEFSSTLLVPFAVLGTPAEGYQKSGTVQFDFLVPFTTSDSGNGNNCVLYRPEPYRSVETSHKVAVYSQRKIYVLVSLLGINYQFINYYIKSVFYC